MALLTAFILAGQTIAAENWPMSRGDRANTGVADADLADRYNLAWSFETGGPVKSSAVIQDGRVYVGSDDGKLYCLDLDSGEPVWTHQTAGPIEAAPLIVGDTIYVGSDDMKLYALNAEDGAPRWIAEADGRIAGAANHTPLDGTPAGVVLVGSYDNHVHCFDAATGQPRWKYETDSYVNAAPAIAGQLAIVGGCDGYVYTLRLDNGELIGRVNTEGEIVGNVVAADGYAYVGHHRNAFYRIDLREQETDWTFTDRDFPFVSSAALHEGKAVVGSGARRLYCLDAATGEPAWAFRARGAINSSPVIAGERVVVGSNDGRLYIVDLESGQMIWSYDIGGNLTASPAVIDGMIVIASEDGRVYALRAAEGA